MLCSFNCYTDSASTTRLFTCGHRDVLQVHVYSHNGVKVRTLRDTFDIFLRFTVIRLFSINIRPVSPQTVTVNGVFNLELYVFNHVSYLSPPSWISLDNRFAEISIVITSSSLQRTVKDSRVALTLLSFVPVSVICRHTITRERYEVLLKSRLRGRSIMYVYTVKYESLNRSKVFHRARLQHCPA